MKIVETKQIEREIYVAPCLECGSEDIQLSDSGYSSFNVGGGKCNKCGHETTTTVNCMPTMDSLAHIWNEANDIKALIAKEEEKIQTSRNRITELKKKAKYTDFLKDIPEDDLDCLMTAEEYNEGADCGALTSDDGNGYWATKDKVSELSIYTEQPHWATHVLWFNR